VQVGPLDTLPGRVIGAKPAAVCRWIFTLLGACPGDTLDDLFPGSDAVGRAWVALPDRPPVRLNPTATRSRTAAGDASDPRRPDPCPQLFRPVVFAGGYASSTASRDLSFPAATDGSDPSVAALRDGCLFPLDTAS